MRVYVANRVCVWVEDEIGHTVHRLAPPPGHSALASEADSGYGVMDPIGGVLEHVVVDGEAGGPATP